MCCVALTLWIVRQLRKNPAFVRTAIALTAAVGCLHGMFFIGSGRLYGTSGSFLRERALAGYDSIAFPGEDEDEFFRLDLYNTLDNLGMYWHVPNIQALSLIHIYAQNTEADIDAFLEKLRLGLDTLARARS